MHIHYIPYTLYTIHTIYTYIHAPYTTHVYTGLGAAGSEHGEGARLRPGRGLLRKGRLLYISDVLTAIYIYIYIGPLV